MENASKALLIAASVLIVIILISFGMIMLNSTQDTVKDAQGVGSSISDSSQTAVGKVESAFNKGGAKKQPISTETSYIGCYADVDGNGSVDGIIYADLAKEGSGQSGDSEGRYEWSKKTNLNNYYISQESYKHGNIGAERVIAPIDKVEENDRFYVMALTDFNAGHSFYWYKNASGKMNSSDTKVEFGEGRKNTEKMIDIWNKNGGEGGYTGATQDNNDVWNHIQGKFSQGWFIPSRGELGAFGYMITKQGMTNYADYGLSYDYWSSSQFYMSNVWGVSFDSGYMDNYYVDSDRYVRLSTTF